MDIAPTPEQILQFGDIWGGIYLSHLTPEERVIGLKPEERVIGLKPEEVLQIFNPEERVIGLKPEERLIGLKPEERLAGLSANEIRTMRAYLERLEQEGGS